MSQLIPTPRTENKMLTHSDYLFIACSIILFSCFLDPVAANATLLDNFGDGLLEVLNSTFLRTCAIAAIIVTGILALSGKMSWAAFLIVLLGIAIIFGAAAIVDFFIARAAGTAGTTFIMPLAPGSDSALTLLC